jgi:polyphenol oxidase
VLRHDEAVGAARFALTDRFGGASGGAYAELNLGGHVGDAPVDVAENRRRLAVRIGLPTEHVLYAEQVHGASVATVDGPWARPAPRVDAMVTRVGGTALAVLVADCVPVLLADPVAGVVGVAHAGRKGMVAGVVPAVLAAMRELGAADVTARIGPSVCGRCYEVPAEMRAAVADEEPASWATSRAGTPALDVSAGVVAQLRRAGVGVRRLEGCTVEDTGLYSYRRDHTTGRFAAIAWLPSPGPEQ